ncbi:MAG: hypothetical protein ACRDGI_11295 [Candidatus Limnocylindrales bacterium]
MNESTASAPAGGTRPARSLLGWALVSYGIAGLVLFALTMAVIVRPLMELGTLVDQRQGIVQFLDVTVQSLDDAGRGSGNAATTLTSAANAAGDAAGLSDRLAASMTALGGASGVTILGTQPLAGLSGQFEAVATQAQQLSVTMGRLSSTLEQNTVDFAGLQTDVGAIREQVAALRTSLLATGGVDALAQWLAPLSILVGIWMTIPAVVSLGIGVRLLRPSGFQQHESAP